LADLILILRCDDHSAPHRPNPTTRPVVILIPSASSTCFFPTILRCLRKRRITRRMRKPNSCGLPVLVVSRTRFRWVLVRCVRVIFSILSWCQSRIVSDSNNFRSSLSFQSGTSKRGKIDSDESSGRSDACRGCQLCMLSFYFGISRFERQGRNEREPRNTHTQRFLAGLL
jgi:hypothetical protein